MLYGAEIWGCTKNLEAKEQVQMSTFRTFFGVDTLHPKASLFIDMDCTSSVGGKSEVCAVLI